MPKAISADVKDMLKSIFRTEYDAVVMVLALEICYKATSGSLADAKTFFSANPEKVLHAANELAVAICELLFVEGSPLEGLKVSIDFQND